MGNHIFFRLQLVIIRRIGQCHIVLQVGAVGNDVVCFRAEIIGLGLRPGLVGIFLFYLVVIHRINLPAVLYFLGIAGDGHAIPTEGI